MLKNKYIFHLIMLVSMSFWGLSWVSAKILIDYIDEYEMVLMRNTLTAISLIPVLIWTKKYFKISAKSIILTFIASLFIILYVKYFFFGLEHGTAALGGAFVTTLVPIITFILMAILNKKAMSKMDIFALLLGAFGVLIMMNIWSFSLEQMLAPQNVYFFAASFCWSIITILSSKTSNTSPIVFSFYINLFSSVLAFLLFVDFNAIPFETLDTKFWVNMLVFAILSSSFATTIYFIGIERLGTKGVAAFLFTVPFFAIVSGAFFLGEKISISIVFGSIFTIIALAILSNILVFGFSKRKS